ncbi:hypothetical protein E2626_11300 [Jeotgalibacillus salarius]|uniref:Uncharacterized protein n=1 Tax=Jeotgalibacillus salarius TaxID=546023 RepID=A0A4Y8LHM0_9BACL|nr:hypothetical protein E2626_11300 [Jeotgalibacillus salarius]
MSHKHLIKAIGISLLISIFVYLNLDIGTTNMFIYMLFAYVVSFIGIYLISVLSAKAYLKFIRETGVN